MLEMTLLYSFFALTPLMISGFILYAHKRTHGSLNDITTESVAYNRSKYGSIVDWDKYSLKVEGESIPILSGEFHYWRVPDRERWQTILQQYRTAGFNTIRIYFHWGYHSPSEDYLLTLCEQLGLFVLAAPGPYICAETQGGGYPSWLVAKRELYIRHNKIMLWRSYDPIFANYEVQWLNNILPILAKHQITDNHSLQPNKRGCVLALQIDNELFEIIDNILPVGLHDQMKVLAKAARDADITVPFFTNDGYEAGGWVPGKNPRFWSKHPFGIDLYGFDKYVVFAPSSSPSNESDEWKGWNPKQIENAMDNLEKTVRGFGGGAKHSPIFIPELQGGWFNNYQLQHTYDQIYDYFGDQCTKLLVDSSLAQGVTMASLYMIYGGTNWGTLGDPDVYTSYDYSASIREFGYLSARGRHVRETLIFAQSFEPYFTKTELAPQPTVTSAVPYIINRQRVSVGLDQQVSFTFFRNFDRKKHSEFQIEVKQGNHRFTMGLAFPYKTSFIGLGNYETLNGLKLIQSTLPIHARMINKETNEETWIIEPNQVGELAFEQTSMTMSGNLHNNVLRSEGAVSILKFDHQQGWTRLTTPQGHLYIIGLTKKDVSTLYGDFQSSYWRGGNKDRYPGLLAWGTDELFYNNSTKSLEINQNIHDSKLHILSYVQPNDPRIAREYSNNDENAPSHLYYMDLEDRSKEQQIISVDLKEWQYKPVDWQSLHWQPLKRDQKNKKLIWDTLDYHFTSGQVIYRNHFRTPSENKKVTLSINMRNRATVLLNGRIIGGHTTYSKDAFSAGAKVGPDPWFIGTHTYDLTPYLSHDRSLDNQLLIIVDSFGLCRQAFLRNDIRNPRGIIKATLNGIENSKDIGKEWQISGVDVRELHQPYGTTGFSDEKNDNGLNPFTPMVDIDKEKLPMHTIPLDLSQGVQWYQFKFDHELKQDNVRKAPLRLHLDGECTIKVILNDELIGLYYGNGDGPQHDFYLPDDLIKRYGNVIKMLVYTWTPTEAQISIQGWHVQFPGSGNLIHSSSSDRHDYIVWKDSVNIG
ncbi:glycoside hydrolase superfamily [Cunninghamella echinulata]|nr:glycoside hydrolase superfamily [Cunninghamella echinulata]